MKQQYNSIRQELSYALYAQDAATRVVARVIKERDAARESVLSFHLLEARAKQFRVELSLTSKLLWESLLPMPMALTWIWPTPGGRPVVFQHP